MKNVEIDTDKKDGYIDWLENICLTFLTNNKIVSKESMLKKLEKKGIDTENCFVAYLLEIYSDKLKKNRIVQKLPLLKDYPICIDEGGIYDEDIEPLYEWELKTIKFLLSKLDKQYDGKNITPETYYEFFIKEIKPYKVYFLNEMEDGKIFEKILPENMSLYWSCRINETISWDESWKFNNVGISIISVLENDYLNKDKSMEEYRHLIR